MGPDITAFFDEASNTISYVVRDPNGSACAIIDSVLDFDFASGRTDRQSADKLIKFVKENKLDVQWLLESHVHADHLSAAPYIQEKVGGKIGIGSRLTDVQETFGKIFNEGTSPVAIIRSLQNYLFRVHKTQIEIKKTGNFDEAIKQLRPPVFWKDKDNFRNHCSKWPTKDVLLYIERLLEAEYMCKTQSSLNNQICEKYILSVAKKGEVYFN